MKIEDYLKRKKELEKLVAENGRDIVKDVISEFMTKYPTVRAVRWHQYTPYFNDGDACTFTVGNMAYCEEPITDEILESSLHDEPWDGGYSAKGKFRKDFEKLEEMASGKLESLFQMTFGDHADIACYRDESGEIIFQIEEYEHE